MAIDSRVSIHASRSAGVRRLCAVGLAAAAASLAGPAMALQTLSEFIDAARAKSLDNVEARKIAEQREAEAGQAWGRILPAFTARGSYTRNQYATEITLPGAPGAAPATVTIVPKNQLDAVLQLDVPLVDLGAWSRIGAATAVADAAHARSLATAQDVERAVTQRYYQVVASESLIAATTRALAAAEESAKVLALRRKVGFASEFEGDRAAAEVERSRQNVTDAELLRAVSRRALGSVSGLTPTPGAGPLSEDLREEAPLEVWQKDGISKLPLVRAAELDRRAAEHASSSAWRSLAPVIAASASERFTNATGFSGNDSVWTIALTATLRLDAVTIQSIRAQEAAESVARVRVDKTRLAASDRIHDAWQQVHAQIAKSRAARAQAKAAANAARVARDSFAAGASNQLEVIQAERDAFGAEVARIQADADLAYARSALRLAAGRATSSSSNGGQ